MALLKVSPRTLVGRPEIGRELAVSYSRPAGASMRRAVAPARADLRAPWWLLYALVPFCVALLTFVEGIPQVGGLRELVEIIIVLFVIGLAAMWIYANRRALAHTDLHGRDETTSHRDVILQIGAPSPRVIHLDSHRHDS